MAKHLYQHIDTLWNYMSMNHVLSPADCIFVLCSNDVRVAEYAAELYHQNLAPYIVFSGGVGRFTQGVFDRTEAETFAAIARDSGVPQDAIIIENQASDTGENVTFTYQALSRRSLLPKRLILVQKPFMEKRSFATFVKQWPAEFEELLVTSRWCNWIDYCNDELPLTKVLAALIEDFERIKQYPDKGFQIEMPIPEEVELAYQAVSRHGF